MESFLFFLLTMAIAAVGGVIGYKLKLPAGAMLGAMVATVIFNLITHHAVFYADLRVVVQLLAGAMIGSRMNRDVLLGMKRLTVPILILVASMFVLNMVFGSALYLFSSLSAPTALFAAAPGGASEMAIVAGELGANAAHVAILQLARLVIIYTCLPFIITRLSGGMRAYQDKHSPESCVALGAGESGAEGEMVAAAARGVHFLLLVTISAIGGIAFRSLGIAAGALIGSMLAGTFYCVARGEAAFPKRLRVCMQISSGAYVGCRLEPETLASMGELLIPLVIMFIGTITFSFGIGFLIHKLTKLDLLTSVLASCPGGRQEMAYLSEDIGADTPSIAIMQTARMVCVIAFFPTLLKLITNWLG